MATPAKSSASSVHSNSSEGGGIIDLIFGFIDRFGLPILLFATVIFFFWMLYAIDFSSVK